MAIVLVLAFSIGAFVFTGCTSTATRESTGEYIDDTVVTAKVKTALARDDSVNGFAVKVETFKGVVQLSGFVDTETERLQAERVAGGVAGVTSVANNILVKTSGP
jgi:hyperosmotically inducible periplasmic protein